MLDDRPWRAPQMSTARGRDGGRIQSGGVRVIAPDAGPAEPDNGRFLARLFFALYFPLSFSSLV